MKCEEILGYVMLGYEKAIIRLMHLDYKSEVIQILVSLIFMLQCTDSNEKCYSITDENAREFFAEEHTKKKRQIKIVNFLC